MSADARPSDAVSAPGKNPPGRPGICDTHFHVFGPYRRFPLPANPSYQPPEATVEAYLEMAGRLGIGRMVVVQGGCYGADNAAMLDAVQSFGRDRACGIALIGDKTTRGDLSALRDGGVCGIRLNAISDSRMDAAGIADRARTAAEMGWHVQLHANPEQIISHGALLRNLPVDVVIDHCGRIDPRLGQEQPAMRTILDLLATGRCWIKLIGYRSIPPGGAGDEMAPFLQRLALAAPERCVWGSDWPHPLMDVTPDTGDLLAQFRRAIDDETLRDRILRDNAQALYGFH